MFRSWIASEVMDLAGSDPRPRVDWGHPRPAFAPKRSYRRGALA
jgi:hypothetical protein